MRDTKSIMLGSAIAGMAIAACIVSQSAQGQSGGTAVVRVETMPPGAAGHVTFSGVPAGTVSAGASLDAAGLSPGSYGSTASASFAGYTLESVACDDGASASPSRGDSATATAAFEIDAGERTTCVFLYRKLEPADDGSEADPPGPGQPAEPGGGSGPASGPGPVGPGPVAGACVPPDAVPKAGTWRVTNHPGLMACAGLMSMPLKPSQETGTLAIQDCGWTVVGTGMSEGTAPLTMRAVDKTSGRYAGTVGGAQDGIPMVIEFNWKLDSEESIVGDLKSEVSHQGMTCRMSRTFEMRYSGS